MSKGFNVLSKVWLFSCFFIFESQARIEDQKKPPKQKPKGIEGVYKGTVEVQFGNDHLVPLEVSLNLTGETQMVQTEQGGFEEVRIVDGSFIIDDEGGPYSFSKVTYNLDSSEIDLRYDRAQLTPAGQSASFRLSGKVEEDGTISGQATSGISGPLGEFELYPSEKTTLTTRHKYLGYWPGSAQIFPVGPKRSLVLNIGAAGTVVANPPNMEFAFSAGKVSQVVYNGVEMRLTHVVTDYLRRRMFFSERDASGKTMISLEGSFDFDRRILVGSINGAYKGRSGKFGVRMNLPLFPFDIQPNDQDER